MPNRVDVLICTHNEAVHVGRALQSLEQQSVGPAGFQVIVVNNASGDDTAEKLKDYAGPLNTLFVDEPRLGLNYARNAGYSQSQADYIAHLDADARAHPEWLENIQRVLAEVAPELCGGPYFPYYLGPKPYWFLDRYNMNYPGDGARYLERHEFLSGTNMIWRRSFVNQLGGFRNEVGLVGRGFARGDETELILRARDQLPGFRIYYDPAIIVEHLTRPETFSLWYWLHRTFVNAAGQEAEFVNRRGKQPDDDAWLLRALVDSAKLMTLAPARATLLRDRRLYPHWQNYVYEQLLPPVSILATAYERWRPRRHVYPMAPATAVNGDLRK